jgi:hypothetical protein
MTCTGAYHKKKHEESVVARKKFAHAYNRLLRDRLAAGQPAHGIKHKAAMLAGFGAGSWSEAAAYKTCRVMASRLMRDPVVREELLKLGLWPHPVNRGDWILASAQPDPHPETGELFP